MPKLIVAAVLFMVMLGAPGVSGAAPASAAQRPEPFIVVLRDGADPARVADEHARRVGAEVGHIYRAALNGYAARIPAARGRRAAGRPPGGLRGGRRGGQDNRPDPALGH